MFDIVQHRVDLSCPRRGLIAEATVAAHATTDQALVNKAVVPAATTQTLYDEREQKEAERSNDARDQTADLHTVKDDRVDVEAVERRNGGQRW